MSLISRKAMCSGKPSSQLLKVQINLDQIPIKLELNQIPVRTIDLTSVEWNGVLMFFKIIPIFQVNTKFLAPLFLAYDDRLKEKEQLIKTYDVSLLKSPWKEAGQRRE